MRKLLLATLLCLGLAPAYAQTPQTKAGMSNEINSNLPDNTVGAITPAGVRQTLQDMLASWQQWTTVNPVGTGYTVQAADYGHVLRVTASTTITLPAMSATFVSFNVLVWNQSGSTVTVVATGPTLINSASSIVLQNNQSAWVVSDGSNYYASPAGPGNLSGTASGTSTIFATSTGTLGNGDCVSIDGNHNLLDAGGPCTTGGGGGTVSAGTAGQFAYYASTTSTIVGNPTLTYVGTSVRAANQLLVGGAALTDTNGLVGLNVKGSTNTDIFGITDGTIIGGMFVGSGALRFKTLTNHALSFATNNGSAAMSIDGSGNTVINGLTGLGTSTHTDFNGNVQLNVMGATNTDVLSVSDGTSILGFFIGGGAFITTLSNVKLGFGTNAITQAQLQTTGEWQTQLTRGEADLRFFGSLSCNPASPSSTNVGTAAVAAYNAGYRHFFIPAGCFINTAAATPWATAFGARTIPSETFWRGEDWRTSGISVCSSYTACTPGVGTLITGAGPIEFRNLFTMDGACYNVDSAAFGRPQYCPINYFLINSGTFTASSTYPGMGIVLNMGVFSAGGTWNGTDQPAFAINQETTGDGIFMNFANGSVAHFLNLFGIGGPVATWDSNGKAVFGNSSTSHSGNGMLLIIDAFATCNIFTNTSGSPGFSCTSDARLKKDIVDTEDQLDWLDSFHIRDFTMRSDGSRHTGVVAQELQVNHPEMVSEGNDGMLMVEAPSQWKLMRAMQELHADVEELKHEIRNPGHAPAIRADYH